MTRTTSEHKADTLTFRLDPTLKTALLEMALDEAKPVGELLRELVRERVEQRRREKVRTEARRQSLECALVARDPRTDEAAVIRELNVVFNEITRSGDET